MEEILFSFFIGIALGGVYFAGLWETVRKLPDAEKPVRRMALSFALRMALALSGFYFVRASGSAWRQPWSGFC